MRWQIAVALFLSGMTVGFFAPLVTSLHYQNDFDVFKIFTLMVTLIVAFLLQYYAHQRHDDLRIEKNLLIEDSKEVISNLKEVRARFLECYYEAQITPEHVRTITGMFRNLANSLFTLEEELASSRVRLKDSELDKLKEKYFEYKIAITGGNFPSAFTALHYNSSERIHKELSRDLHVTILSINRY